MNITKKAIKPEYVLDHSFDEEDKEQLSSPTLPELSLSSAIDNIGIGRFHYILLFVVAWNFLNTSFQFILPGLMLPTFFKEFELDSFELSIYGFCEYFAYLSGSILAYLLAESFGRRKMILITLIIPAILIALCAIAQSIYIIVLLRFLSINSLVVNYYYTYSFMLELIPNRNKPFLTFYIQITNSIGVLACILLTYWVFDSLDYGNWQLLMIFSSILVWIAFSLNASILNESPYYNMKKGNSEAAFLVINRIAKFNIKNPDFLTLEKKRMISNWFIRNESNFNINKKNNENTLNENKFNINLIAIWFIDLFIYHGFDFILPIFLVLQKNEIHPFLHKNDLLYYLFVMHLISYSYLFFMCFVNKIDFTRKIFIYGLLILILVVAIFMGLNLVPSFYFWMVVFKFLMNLYNFMKLQIISGNYEKKIGSGLKIVKLFGKIGMICSTFLLVFFINIHIYVIYFIFAGLLAIDILLWGSFQYNFTAKEEIDNNELNKPLNNEGYDNIYRIIEIPM